MNVFDFYFPRNGKIEDKSIVVQDYEFESFLRIEISPLFGGVGVPSVFWSEVHHLNGQIYFHLRIAIMEVAGSIYNIVALTDAIRKYVTNFQTTPVMWNDMENIGEFHAL